MVSEDGRPGFTLHLIKFPYKSIAALREGLAGAPDPCSARASYVCNRESSLRSSSNRPCDIGQVALGGGLSVLTRQVASVMDQEDSLKV